MTTQHNKTSQSNKTAQHTGIAQQSDFRVPLSTEAGNEIDTSGVMTLEQLLALCVQLQPVEAAMQGDSDLCVTPLITTLFIDGKIVELKLRDGRWGAGYPRVSGEVQRAAGSAAGKSNRNRKRRRSNQQVAQMQHLTPEHLIPEQVVLGYGGREGTAKLRGSADGYSEEEQLTRQIRYFVRQGLAFRVYSDCGLTGEYPSNDPRLIKKLLDSKAARYQKIYERTLLDETSLLRRTPAEIASMRAYLEKRVAQIKAGSITDNEFAMVETEPGLDDDEHVPGAGAALSDAWLVGDPANSSTRRPGRPRRKVYFRQAFTQLWRDIQAGKVDIVAVSDRSRLCRAADLESEFLMLLGQHQTRLVGLIEDLSTLDVSDPLKKGFAYMIASVNEYRLEEVCGHSFRGLLQLLESGHPHGQLPWWLIRDMQGKAVEMPAYAPHARRVAELFLSGLGVGAIATKLHDEGIKIGGEPLTAKMVRYVLDSDAVKGLHWQFGLAWDIYPPLLSPETVAELRERRKARRNSLVPSSGARQPGRAWANHVLTGLLRCGTCGYLLRYLHPSRTQRLAGKVGYYFCPAPHKSRPGEPPHAYMNESKLTAFLEELLGENPRLIREALSAGGDRAARSSAQRALLEERLQQARREYTNQEERAHMKAVHAALAAGIREGATSFSSVVAEIQRGLLEADQGTLTALEEELARLGAQAGQDKQAERVLAAVGQLEGKLGGGLDVLTRNSLLKAIFAEITVHPILSTRRAEAEQNWFNTEPRWAKAEPIAVAGSGAGVKPRGCLILHLVGVDTPLSPVRLRRLRGKDMRLPSVKEWIADIYALAPVEELAIPNVRTRRAFYCVFRRFVNSIGQNGGEDDDRKKTPLQRLMACIQADHDFPKRSRGRETIMAHLTRTDIYKDVREHFEEAWNVYLDAERRRLSAPPVVND